MSRPKKNAKKQQPETPPMPEVEKTLEPDELSNLLEAILVEVAAPRPVRWNDTQRDKLQWLLRDDLDALWLLDLLSTDLWTASDAARLSAMISIAVYAELYGQAQEDRWDALAAQAEAVMLPADERSKKGADTHRENVLKRQRETLRDPHLSKADRHVLETAVASNVALTPDQRIILAVAVEMAKPLTRKALLARGVPAAIAKKAQSSHRVSKDAMVTASNVSRALKEYLDAAEF